VKVALDTNILVYAEGVSGALKGEVARGLMDRLGDEAVVALQTLAEFFNVLTVKARIPVAEAAILVEELSSLLETVPMTVGLLSDATDLVQRHRLQIFDAIILCAAAEAGCGLLLSEDMQDGFVYRGVTIANPFAETLHPLLASLLEILP
jgi:predicted nucleic acid-binding protein